MQDSSDIASNASLGGSDLGILAGDGREVIDSAPIGLFQIRIIVLCLLAAVIEGFDHQVIAVAGPILLKNLGLGLGNMGPLYSVGLVAAIIGGSLLGPLGDRFGRKWLLVVSLMTFGLATLIIPWLTTLPQVLIARFVSGFAFGGAAVAFIAIPVEYVATRLRERVVAIIWAGLPIGGVSSSLAGHALIEDHGWHILFVIGGVFPLVLALLITVGLPESVSYLIARGQHPAKVEKLLRKISPNAVFEGQTVPSGNSGRAMVPLRTLFTQGRALGSALIWFSLFLAYTIINLIVAWTPALLSEAGASMATAALGLAVFNAVSLVAGVSIGFVLHRPNANWILAACFVLAAAVIISSAAVPLSTGRTFVIVGLIGLLVGGGATGLVAIASTYYPTALRATGIGWSLGFARIGSICGPLIGSLFFVLGMTIDLFFASIAVPAGSRCHRTGRRRMNAALLGHIAMN